MARNEQESDLLRVSESQKKALAYATIAALIVGFIFLKVYLMHIAVAAIVAYLFQPIYKALLSRGYKEGSAATITFLITLLSVIIPLGLVIFISAAQLNSLSKSINSDTLNVDFNKIGQELVNTINNFAASHGLSFRISESSINSAINSLVQDISNKAVDWLTSSITGFFSMITTFIIYIYVFLSLLRNQKKIIGNLSTINPLGEKITHVYLGKMGSMTKAMVRGQFIIAVMQGLASAVGLYIVGFHSLFFFFFLILTVLSFIPLGAGIVTIPIGIVLIVIGDVWQGVFLIANHLIIVTNIDNVMRPRLVPQDARLDPALTILSVFAGLAMFGFIGVVLGPVLMIVILTTIQMFLEVFRNVNALNRSKSNPNPSIWNKVKRLNPLKTAK